MFPPVTCRTSLTSHARRLLTLATHLPCPLLAPAATTFFELLVLKSTNYISVKQAEPFATIKIKKTARLSSRRSYLAAL